MILTNAQNALLAKKSDIPFFADLTHEEVLKVTEEVEFLRINKGERIFDQGDKSTSIYYVVRGSVEIVIKKENEKGEIEHIPVATLQKRAFFGEMAFITGDPRTARAIAAENDTAILTFKIVNDVESGDLSTIKTLALVYFYFAQDLAQKLKVTSANYAKIKTVDDIAYDDLVALVDELKNEIISFAQNANVLTITEPNLDKINSFFPISYDPITQKEIIKTAISESFALNEKDLIIFAKDRVVIRLFKEVEIPTIQYEPKEKNLLDILQDSTSSEYINDIFTNYEFFEKEVLNCHGEDCRSSLLRAFRDILEKMPQRKYLSFLHMISYSHFRLSKAVEALELYLTQAIRIFLINSCALSEFKVKEILALEISIASIRNISLFYIKKFKDDLTNMIADTFVEACKLDTTPEVVIEAFKGTLEYKPLLSKPDGGFVAGKADQVKIRVSQASKDRETKLIDYKNEYERYKKQLISTKKQLEAFELAKMISLDKIKNYDYKQLRDITVNEENQFSDIKRVLAFLPSGEKTLALKEMSARGVKAATNEVQKEEYKRAAKFFDGLHDNNTEKALNQKKSSLLSDQDKLTTLLNKAEEALKNAETIPLNQFDVGLSKIYEAIVQNLGKKS